RSSDRREGSPVRRAASVAAEPALPTRARRDRAQGAGQVPRRSLSDGVRDGRRARRRGARRALSALAPGPADARSLSRRGRRRRPVYKRGSVWVTAALVATAFAGGAVWMQSNAPVQTQVAGPNEGKPRRLPLPMTIRSIPDGADVYVLGTNEHLGKTSFNYK